MIKRIFALLLLTLVFGFVQAEVFKSELPVRITPQKALTITPACGISFLAPTPVPVRMNAGELIVYTNKTPYTFVLGILRKVKEKTRTIIENGWAYLKEIPGLPTPGLRYYPHRFS